MEGSKLDVIPEFRPDRAKRFRVMDRKLFEEGILRESQMSRVSSFLRHRCCACRRSMKFGRWSTLDATFGYAKFEESRPDRLRVVTSFAFRGMKLLFTDSTWCMGRQDRENQARLGVRDGQAV